MATTGTTRDFKGPGSVGIVVQTEIDLVTGAIFVSVTLTDGTVLAQGTPAQVIPKFTNFISLLAPANRPFAEPALAYLNQSVESLQKTYQQQQEEKNKSAATAATPVEKPEPPKDDPANQTQAPPPGPNPGDNLANDDKPAPTDQTPQQPTVVDGSRPQIVPKPNILDKFSSYTYRISVYLMTPGQYAQLARSHKKKINSYNLLFQSAGAPVNTGGFQGAAAPGAGDAVSVLGGTAPGAAGTAGAVPDAGRNPAFPLDFYIESCSIMNLLEGKGSGTAHSVATMKFTVIEPVGITLIDRLYEAVQDSAPTDSAGKVNYQAAQYLMAIRWYGYDQNGNLAGGSASNSDPLAAVEKFIPFVINKISWRVSAKATEYEFDCTPVGQIIAGGTRRGVVPYDIQLSQGTVGAILAGNLGFVDKPPSAQDPGQPTAPVETESAVNTETGETYQRIKAPAKANAADTTRKTVKQGLMAAMNEFSQGLTTGKNPIYEFADQYEIVFAKGAEAIRDAAIVLPDKKKEARLTPMSQPATTDAQSLKPSTQSKDTTVATKSIYAGQPIVQVIDQVIRNSSYITSQALTIYDGDQERANDDNKKKNKPVDWYRITMEAVPVNDKPDKLRNDYAYKIRYIISTYRIDNYDSKYFPLGTFRGVHKSYPWIFTGKNIAVLDYSETLNSSHTMLVSGSDPTNSAAETERRKVAATLRELLTYAYGPASGETRQGTRGKGNEPSSNIADSLYGGSDLANTKLTIIGDPAWVQQGSLAGGVSADLWEVNSFLSDGTINFDAEQINFEVTWNRPADYNLTTGLADPNSINKPPISRVYTAKSVTSDFKQGTFTQTIEGLLFNLPKPDGSNKAPSAQMPNKNDNGRTDPANQTAATQERTGVILNSPGRVNDPRKQQFSSAGVGADSTSTRPAPPNPLPTKAQIYGSFPGRQPPVLPKDTVRALPPPTAPTSTSGENIGADLGSPPPSRLKVNTETGQLYDAGTPAAINNTQPINWEP
jgi:hypothetical protein